MMIDSDAPGNKPSIDDVSTAQRALEALRKRNAELEALYRLSLEINAQRGLPELLRLVVVQAAELLNTHRGVLYLVRPDGQSLELVVSYNQPSDLTGLVLAFGDGLSGGGHKREVMMVEDYHTWRAGGIFRSIRTGGAGAPLAGRAVIGVINVMTLTGGLFTDDGAPAAIADRTWRLKMPACSTWRRRGLKRCRRKRSWRR
jgi:GAF domain-containing protein